MAFTDMASFYFGLATILLLACVPLFVLGTKDLIRNLRAAKERGKSAPHVGSNNRAMMVIEYRLHRRTAEANAAASLIESSRSAEIAVQPREDLIAKDMLVVDHPSPNQMLISQRRNDGYERFMQRTLHELEMRRNAPGNHIEP